MAAVKVLVNHKRDGGHVVVMQMIIALVKRDNLARHVCATDVVAIQLANQVAEKVLGMSYDLHIFSNRIGDWGGPLLQGNRGHRPSVMLSWHRIQPPYRRGVLRGGAERGRSERSDGTESPGTISHSQEAPCAGGPPPTDPADEPPVPAPAGSAGAQEPAPAASPPKAGGKGGVRARGGGK